jgi:hypothetical protein
VIEYYLAVVFGSSRMSILLLLILTWINLSSSICIDSFNSLCINVMSEGNLMRFDVTCSPIRGFNHTTWCGFGFSDATTDQMFPADIIAIQYNSSARSVFLEDRNAFAGYSTPPCFQQQISQLVTSSRGEDGVLHATWTRIANAPSPHVNLTGNVTIIGAASFDTPDAAEQCLDFMQTHTIVQPGVAFTFPS